MQKKEQANIDESKNINKIYFQDKINLKQKKLSLLTVYTQTISYYDNIYTPLILIFQLFIFIYKYNILFYEDNIVAGEIILLVLAYFLNNWRLNLGQAGNKGKKYGAITIYVILTIIMIIGFFYIVAIQQNILWLQFIQFIIGLIFICLELFFMIIVTIVNRVYQ